MRFFSEKKKKIIKIKYKLLIVPSFNVWLLTFLWSHNFSLVNFSPNNFVSSVLVIYYSFRLTCKPIKKIESEKKRNLKTLQMKVDVQIQEQTHSLPYSYRIISLFKHIFNNIWLHIHFHINDKKEMVYSLLGCIVSKDWRKKNEMISFETALIF